MKKRFGIYALSTLFMLMLLSGAFFVIVPDPMSAAQDGDYIYTTWGSPTVATITGYTGDGGAITIPSMLGGFSTAVIGAGAFSYCTNLTSVTIPSSVKQIGTGAFDSCTNLTSVTIPSSVTSIGALAFSYCTSLTSLSIPDSVTSIGDKAFYWCTSLTTVTIPNSITSIGPGTFHKCSSMTSVTIPNSVTSIGIGAFQYCSNLTSMTFKGLIAPTSVGVNWIFGTNAGILGHASNRSNLPGPGSAFYGLTMGMYDPVVPQAPTGLTAAPGNAQVVLTWVAPSDNGWSAITGYKVYRSATENGTYALISSPSGLNYTNTGLTDDQTYWYKVSAVNVVGEGAQSHATSVVLPKSSMTSEDMILIFLAIIAIIGVMVLVALMMRKRK
jgi:hypothetical protein